MFATEMEMASKLRHRNIVQVQTTHMGGEPGTRRLLAPNREGERVQANESVDCGVFAYLRCSLVYPSATHAPGGGAEGTTNAFLTSVLCQSADL
mmetsp:Transcript_40527/g.77417  ORF Transcript_40527/g.77417 Transcript_40527/m.77417 type:complete len:94 (-) Transcript_40527:240-521(-)|eukprot:CAMPEP_0114324766 /NCGR_PEP_ID=MMETSP0059-20121206/28707_1 /TAXON_ID=36894 /ORGANISM="Pyramimonas parkeae, Strain CCMP726" /LENGTH=93 /DNA_ID=CAMNT_0001453377 /DNA_START=249 /DNA_END=530 /DNA_ORIENTATION=+